MLSLRDKAELGVPTNYMINGGAESSTSGWSLYNDTQTVTLTIASPGVFTVASTTNFYNGMPIAFTTTGALPTGITSGTTYYVTNLNVDAANKFRVSATLGGSDVNTSGTQSGTHTARPLVPLDGTGGTVSGLTLSSSSSSPLRGLASFLLAQTNSTVVAGQGASRAFTIDNADQGNVLSLQFDFNASSTFSASSGQVGSISDLQIFIYDVTNAVLIPVSPSVITANGSNNFPFKAIFQTASNSTSYRLCIHSATTNANATGWSFKYDGMYCGPQPIVQGSVVTPSVAYSPTFTGLGTPSAVSIFSRRNGGRLEVFGKYTQGVATAVANQITLGYNGGNGNVTVDPTQVPSIMIFGAGAVNVSSASEYTVIATGGTNYFQIGAQASGTNGLAPIVGGVGTGTVVSFFASIPIQGWEPSTTLSQDSDTRVVAAIYTTLSSGTITSGTALKYTTLKYDSHAAYNTSTGQYIAPISGPYKFTVVGPFTGGSLDLNFQVNGVTVYPTYATWTSSGRSTSSVTALLKAGEAATITPNGSTTTGDQASSAFFVERISGPATIAASESINASYFSTSTASISANTQIPYGSKNYDSHGAYNGTTFTAPAVGKYRVSAAFYSSSTSYNAVIYKNNSIYIQGTTGSANTIAAVNGTVPLNAGEILDIRTDTTITLTSGTLRAYFMIEKVG